MAKKKANPKKVSTKKPSKAAAGRKKPAALTSDRDGSSVWQDVSAWQELYQTLTIIVSKTITGGKHKALPKSTAALLDRFEVASNFLLPLSFRAFAQVFGSGELGHTYRVYVPQEGNGKWAAECDLAHTNTSVQSSIAHIGEELVQPDMAKRMIYFGFDPGGGYVGFDPTDVRNKKMREYGIYELVRPYDGEFDLLATSFPAFVQNHALRLYQDFLPF